MLRRLLYSSVAAVFMWVGSGVPGSVSAMSLESKVLEIKYNDNSPFFPDKGKAIEYLKNGGSLELAVKCASLVNQDLKVGFNAEHAISLAGKASVNFIETMFTIKDNYRRNIFDGNLIERMNHARFYLGETESAALAFASKLAKIQYPDGKAFMYGEDIVNLYYNRIKDDQRITPEAIEAMVSWARQYKKPLKGYELVRYIHLGKENHEIFEHLSTGKDLFYTDTEKPDYRLVVSAADYNGAFHGKAIKDIFTTLAKKHDIRLKICTTDLEIADELKSSNTPEGHLFVGHGSEHSINLGNKDPPMWTRPNSARQLDISDSHVAKYMRMQENNRYTHVFACSAGQGGSSANNLANWISRNLRGQLAAPVDVQNVNAIKIQSEYPFVFIFTKSEHELNSNVTYYANLFK